MKKFRLLFVPALILLMLSGCGERNEISSSRAGEYLNKLYNKKFSYIDTETTEREDGRSDICYTFKDEDGIPCHVFFTPDGDTDDWQYHVTEDYQVTYLNAHPELYSGLTDSEWVVRPSWNMGDNMINSVRFTVYYDKYEEIEEAVRFADGFLGEVESIVSENMGGIKNPPEIYSEGAVVGFGCDYIPTNPDVFMYFPLGSSYISNGDSVINTLQVHYNGLDPADIIYQPPVDFSSVPDGQEIPTIPQYDDSDDYYDNSDEYYYEDEYYEGEYYEDSNDYYDDNGYYDYDYYTDDYNYYY